MSSSFLPAATRTLACALVLGALGADVRAQGNPASQQDPNPVLHETRVGHAVLSLDAEALATVGLTAPGEETAGEAPFSLPADSALEVEPLDRFFATFAGGRSVLNGSLEIGTRQGAGLVLQDPVLVPEPNTGGSVAWLVQDGVAMLQLLAPSLVELDVANERLHWSDVQVVLTEAAAGLLEVEAAGLAIGTFTLEAEAVPSGRIPSAERADGHPVSEGGTARLGGIGPDVIVGDLPSVSNWGRVGTIRAYSVGTTSCNIGDQNLLWISGTNEHPVIGQNLYRLKDGRFEQIGQSWLKHGFFALSGSLCFNDCQSTNGTELGVHCSDPYSSGLNGSQSRLGPRHEVNAFNGVFTYPPFQPATNGTIGRRLQVEEDDVNPALNAGARYFVEGHYVTPDDAQAGNGLNNASYREVLVSGGSFNLNTIGQTVREQPAITAWSASDPTVKLAKHDAPNDGRFNVLSQATDLGNGMWNYEYAVHNLNSHLGGQSFTVPIPPGCTVTNVGFHDVFYHSGEPYSNADWTATVNSDSVSWATETFAQNQNANALRWGTVYNFRFDCDVAPDENAEATLGLFRPSTPDSIQVFVKAPQLVALSDVLAGTVNAGIGAPTDVLFINGSAGGANRQVDLNQGDPISLDIALPPSQVGSACFVLYAYSSLPTQGTITPQPMNIGNTAMPTPLSGGAPTPVRIANSFPPQFDGQLGADDWPGTGRDKAPRNLLDLPGGLSRSECVFFQGFIIDRDSPHGTVGITNGITLKVQ